MPIRIGSSCALSVPMAVGKAVEARILSDGSSKWQEVCKYAINNKQFLILNPCVNDGWDVPVIPSDYDWKRLIKEACDYLKLIGGNYNNCKITVINEPTKHFRNNGGVARYTNFINMAWDIVKNYNLRMGAGNMEFYDAAVLGDWYGYICANANFTDLDIHIQASCDNEERTKKYTDYAYGLATQYKKKLDCTEAFYGNITTSSGYNLLKNIQLKHAIRVGCENFLNVFNIIDTSVFPILAKPEVKKKWFELCFVIDGKQHSQYWYDWLSTIEFYRPQPNIIELEIEDDDMKLTVLKPGSKGNQVYWLQEILEIEYGFENAGNYDGIYGSMTLQQVKAYQAANNLTQDGFVGKFTMADLISKSVKPNYWMDRLKIFMAYE